MKKFLKKTKLLRCALLLCLCVSLLCPAAFAETAVDLVNTEGEDSIHDFCTLPDGGLVFAGFTEAPAASGAEDAQKDTRGRLICLNPDRTVRWVFEDDSSSVYGPVVLTQDGRIAAESFSGCVKFFTPDGKPAGPDMMLPDMDDTFYTITAHGVLRAERHDGSTAEEAELIGWDGNVLFRIHEPESMCCTGYTPIAEDDGLVLFGQAAGNPAEAPAKIMKVDLQGNTVWETELPFIQEKRDSAGVGPAVRTGDGGYLAIVQDLVYQPKEDVWRGFFNLVKLDGNGLVCWIHEPTFGFQELAHYNGMHVVYGLNRVPGENRYVMNYLWLDVNGKELGTTQLPIPEAGLSPYSSENASASGEKLVPTGDGLWQLVSFWEPDPLDDDEFPAMVAGDSLLIRVPELGADGQ